MGFLTGPQKCMIKFRKKHIYKATPKFEDIESKTVPYFHYTLCKTHLINKLYNWGVKVGC